jgi:hypothetical protein
MIIPVGLLRFLDRNYQEKLRDMEREKCSCLRDKDNFFIKTHYPACVSIPNLYSSYSFFPDDAFLDIYWEVIVNGIKEKYPEIVMEAFLLSDTLIHY